MTAPRARVLVDAAYVQAHANDPDVRIVEVDVDTALYEKGHVPGAIAWNWTTELNDPVRRDIVGREDIERLLGRSGIAPTTEVVLYGDHNNWFAAFAAWILKYYGHDRVKLLDGGRRKWETLRLPFVAETPRVAPTTYRVTRTLSEVRAERDDVLRVAKDRTSGLVDVRSPDEYTGKVLAPPGLSETAQRGGHVPGALNVPWAKAVNDDGTFRTDEELRALYAPLGDRPVVTYCRIGERSAHTWFALHEVLGRRDVRNYDGSWTEYGNLVGVPIAVGPQP